MDNYIFEPFNWTKNTDHSGTLPVGKRLWFEREMADRFFKNEMLELVAEDEAASESAKDSLTKLLHLPYKTLSHRLKISALDLKQMVSTTTHYTLFFLFSFFFFVFSRNRGFWVYGFLLILGFLECPPRKTLAFRVNCGF